MGAEVGTGMYKDGGKVKSEKINITDIVKEAEKIKWYEKAAQSLPIPPRFKGETSTAGDLSVRAENIRYGKIPRLVKKALKSKSKKKGNK